MEGIVKAGDAQQAEELQLTINELGPWFQNLHLPDGTQTAPDHPFGDFPNKKWQQVAQCLPHDLQGWRVLDVGCNAGFYSFELAKRGAHVIGIDNDQHFLEQAEWAAELYSFKGTARFRQMHVYDLAHLDEDYDLVMFMGMFYHLRYPTLALDIVAQKVRKLMVFQTITMPGEEVFDNTYDCWIHDRDTLLDNAWPKMAFIEHCFSSDPTHWWIPNRACAEAMLRSSGMQIVARPSSEIYMCEPDPNNLSCCCTWNAAELLAATGRPWRYTAPENNEYKQNTD